MTVKANLFKPRAYLPSSHLSRLLAPLGPKLGGRPGTFASVNVVSPELCEATLRQLEPSLELYKGCDILDINPGVGLWSSKVHDLLQPRSHYLLEAQEVYQPFLKPLLDQPHSRYRYLADNGIHTVGEEEIFRVGFFKKLLIQNRAEREGTDTGGSHNTQSLTLVLARLARNSKKPLKGRSASWTESIMFSYIRSIFDGEEICGPGRVRTLLWLVDHEKFHYMPRSIVARSNVSNMLEIASNTSEIAGSSDQPLYRRRAKLEVLSALNTARRMHQSGTCIRSDRRSKLHKEASISVAATELCPKAADVVAPGETRSHALMEELSEMDALERKFYVEESFKRHKSNKVMTSNDKRYKESTPEYSRMVELEEKMASLTMSKPLLIHHPALYKGPILLEDLYRLECDVQRTPVLDPTFQTKKQEMDALAIRIMAWKEGLKKRLVVDINQLDDNARAFGRVPPSAHWDRRQFEPLTVHEDEFFPRMKMALLDIVPKEASEIGGRAAIHEMLFARTLWKLRKLSIDKALDQVAHGSAKALIPNCPTLRNPLKGGRMHPENLRGYMLTDEMLQELFDAWNRWPFRRADEELLANSVGSNFDVELDDA